MRHFDWNCLPARGTLLYDTQLDRYCTLRGVRESAPEVLELLVQYVGQDEVCGVEYLPRFLVVENISA